MLHNHLCQHATPEFKWEIANPYGDISPLSHYDIEGICGVRQPFVSLNLTTSEWKLNESTYKELAQLVDPNFLSQQVRASELSGLTFRKFTNRASTFVSPSKNIMEFLINSSKHSENRVRYVMSAMFDEWEELGQDVDFDFKERSLMLLWTGNLKLHCTCPSFLWWGYQYLCTAMDSAIVPISITPGTYDDEPWRRRNWQQRGIVCKHLNRLLQALPFYSGTIAKEMRRQFG